MKFFSIIALPVLGASAHRQTGTVQAVQKIHTKNTPVEQSEQTPVDKVVKLLSKLKSKIETEGKTEAANYDKFACFCKDQADEKHYDITKAEERVELLSAESTKLGTQLTTLAQAIIANNTAISGVELDINTDQGTRDSGHSTYLQESKAHDDAIAATRRAIEIVQNSKDNLKGDVKKGYVALLQKVRPTMSLTAVSEVLEALNAPTAAHAHASEFHSNQVLTLLNNLLIQFKESKRELDMAEEQDAQAHNMLQGKRANRIKAVEMERQENKKVEARKTSEKNEKDAEVAKLTTDKTRDEAYLRDATAQCESKAGEFDSRSKIRADEIAAIQKAIDFLGQADFGANKKLTGLTAVKATVHQHAQPAAQSASASSGAPSAAAEAAALLDDSSFVQLKSSLRGLKSGSVHETENFNLAQRATEDLARAGSRLGSPALTQLALRLRADHFVKVRQLIQDLIDRLRDQAEAEEDQKIWCDAQMGDATSQRDEEAAEIEKIKGDLATTRARIQEHKDQITDFEKEKTALQKELDEARVLRAAESEENLRTIADAEDGRDAVADAIIELEKVYPDGGTGGAGGSGGHGGSGSAGSPDDRYVPYRHADADKDNKTFGDVAPETFEDGYQGELGAGTGIVGILNVIHADFVNTISVVDHEETTAHGEFTTYEGRTEDGIDDLGEWIGDEEGYLDDELANLEDFETDLNNAETLHKEALEQLTKLQPVCVDDGLTWKVRAARRKQEVEALREALDILRSLD